MRRWVIVSCVLGLAGCATTPHADDAALRERCRASLDADERCVGLLTGSADTREAEKEVEAAEADRERDAFHARLRRLREAEEKRQNKRARSSTVARAMWEEEDGDGLAELLEASRAGDEEIDDGGSSVRGLKASPPPPPPPRPKPPVVVVEPPPPLEIAPDGTPGAGTYLFGAKCLLRSDLVLIRQTLEEAKKNQTSDDVAGSIALVILDAEGLLSRVDRALEREKVTEAPLCSSGDVRSMVTLLRELVGPRPTAKQAGDAYGRGLARLAKELEKRAQIAGSQ